MTEDEMAGWHHWLNGHESEWTPGDGQGGLACCGSWGYKDWATELNWTDSVFNGLDLTEAEAIKKRWQEYTKALYKKELHDQDNHDGVIIHLGPDILECEVKWALESITTNKDSGGDGIPVELLQILKRWCCESAALNTPANLENSAGATGLENVSFHSNPKERQFQRMLKLPHDCPHLTR